MLSKEQVLLLSEEERTARNQFLSDSFAKEKSFKRIRFEQLIGPCEVNPLDEIYNNCPV